MIRLVYLLVCCFSKYIHPMHGLLYTVGMHYFKLLTYTCTVDFVDQDIFTGIIKARIDYFHAGSKS